MALLAAVLPPDAAGREAIGARAAMLRPEGTAAIAPAIVKSLLPAARSSKPEIAAFVRELVMRQDPDGYAGNDEALAAATDPGPIDPELPLLVIAGTDDALSPPSVSHEIARPWRRQGPHH